MTDSLVPDAIYQSGEEVEVYESYDGIELTPQESAFCDFYVGDARFVGGTAYQMATGVKEDWNRTAGKWLAKPHIKKAIKARLDVVGLTTEAALAELKEVALADFRDLIDVKMRNGEVISTRMDLGSKVRALEIILRAHNALDNQAAVQNAVVININTPGLHEDELA
jgi:hypothetical protein